MNIYPGPLENLFPYREFFLIEISFQLGACNLIWIDYWCSPFLSPGYCVVFYYDARRYLFLMFRSGGGWIVRSWKLFVSWGRWSSLTWHGITTCDCSKMLGSLTCLPVGATYLAIGLLIPVTFPLCDYFLQHVVPRLELALDMGGIQVDWR